MYYCIVLHIIQSDNKKEKCFLTNEDLLKLSEVSICNSDHNELIDINTISIEEKDPVQRFLKFIEQIRNPYCYRCGDIGVKIEFDESLPYLEPTLIEFLIKKKQG